MAVILVEINNVILRLRTDSTFTEESEADRATQKRIAQEICKLLIGRDEKPSWHRDIAIQKVDYDESLQIQGDFFNWAPPDNVSTLAPPNFSKC